MTVVMVRYDFEQRMPLYMCIRINNQCHFFNKDSHLNEVFIVVSITAWVNIRPPVLSKKEIHTDKKLRQDKQNDD